MKTIYSKQHKELTGSVNDAPYTVTFDAEGYADVDDAVAEQLTSNGRYGVELVDDDESEQAAKEAAEAEAALKAKEAAEAEAARLAKESKKDAKNKGSEV